MKNYICINGNKTELTKEQLKQLGIELPKANSFDRSRQYYTIDATGEVFSTDDINHSVDILRYRTANYCTDPALLEQRALHETLNRLLWRYSMEHDGDKIDWRNACQRKYYIAFNHNSEQCYIESLCMISEIGTIYFRTKDIAHNAIEEIVKPFMKAHPDFRFSNQP